MMDFEKLIEAVRLCGSTPKVDQCKQCAYWSGGDMSKCIPRMTTDAATALSTLQAENTQLRAELEQVKKKNKYSAHDVALILSDVFGDSCACNFNGNDEWLPEKCELLDTCPDVVGVACWEQYLKWRGQKEE